MTKNVVYKKPKWLRRIASAFIDLLATFVVALLLSFLTTPLSNYLFDAENANQTIEEYFVESKLYMIDENDELVINNNVLTYDERLTYFYSNYTDDLNDYIALKIENNQLFDASGKPLEFDVNNPEQRVAYLNFYQPISDSCIDILQVYLKNNFDDYNNALQAISSALYFSILIAAIIGLLIFYLIIPLIDKRGRTIGKMVFRLNIISKASIDPTPSKLQILFRQLITIFFEYVLTISTLGMFGIPLPLSLIATVLLVIFTKYNQSLHDILSSTFLVDDYIEDRPLNEGEKYILTYINVED